MNKNLIKNLIVTFSRRAKPEVDSEQMQRMQFELFEKCSKKGYKMPNDFTHEDILYEEVVYGNKCDISGVTENNEKSSEFTKQVIQSGRPRTVILGGMNDTQAMALLEEPFSRFLNIENLATAKLFCKSTLLPIIQNRIEEDPNYLYDKRTKIVWKVDQLNRCFQINDYVNASYESLFLDYKLIYGKPSSVFIYEDLMLTLSLEELKEMFENTLQKVIERNQNSCEHFAPVLLQQMKTYAMHEEPRLYTKEVTYTTALLNRLTKIESKNLLLIPTCFVKKVADQVHNIDFEPQTIYRKWVDDHNSQSFGKFSEIMANEQVHELLEKFAILSILKGFHLQLILHQGKNFFKNSIFSELLGEHRPQQILQLYRPHKAKYMQKLFQIQRQRIKNKIQYHPPQTEFMYLKDQFETLQKRKEMFLYEFQPKNYVTENENAQKIENLTKKIDEIVATECDQFEKTLIEQYKKGNKTKEGIILYTKLIGKANVQLKDRVRLPYFHFNSFRGFYKEYFRDSLLFDQDVKQRKLQMKKLRKLEYNFDKIGKQLKDPQVLRKYLTGEMGKVKQINMYEDENGEMDVDGELDDIQEVVAQLGNEEMQKEFEEFRRKHPREDHAELGEDEGGEEDWDEEGEDGEDVMDGRQHVEENTKGNAGRRGRR